MNTLERLQALERPARDTAPDEPAAMRYGIALYRAAPDLIAVAVAAQHVRECDNQEVADSIEAQGALIDAMEDMYDLLTPLLESEGEE